MHLVTIIGLLASRAFAVLGVGDTAVVNDPALTALTTTANSSNKLYQTFMTNQVVQDAITIKNNLLEAEEYYNYYYNASKSRGGLMGYYKSMVMSEVNQIVSADKAQLEYQASNVTGPNAVNDFMNAAGAAAVNAVQQAGNAANSSLASGVSSFNSAYNNATNYQVQDANMVVQTWQQQQNIQTGQLAKQVTISSAVASAVSASNSYVAQLGTSINNLAQTATQSNLTTQQLDQMLVSYASINSKLMIEIHHLLNAQTTLQKTQLDAASTALAIAQQTATDLSAYQSQNAAWRAQNGSPTSAITSQMQK